MSRLDKYYDWSIEKIIYSVGPDYGKSLERLVYQLSTTAHTSNKDQETIKRLELAKKRVDEPLEMALRILFFLFPFGITSSFTPDQTSDLKKFKQLGYLKKIKDFYIVSFIGLLFYLVTPLVIMLWV